MGQILNFPIAVVYTSLPVPLGLLQSGLQRLAWLPLLASCQSRNRLSLAGVVWVVLGLCPAFLVPLYWCLGDLGNFFLALGRVLDPGLCSVGEKLYIYHFLSFPWRLPWIVSVLWIRRWNNLLPTLFKYLQKVSEQQRHQYCCNLKIYLVVLTFCIPRSPPYRGAP